MNNRFQVISLPREPFANLASLSDEQLKALHAR
jgi:hypothetical protein